MQSLTNNKFAKLIVFFWNHATYQINKTSYFTIFLIYFLETKQRITKFNLNIKGAPNITF